MAQVRRLSATFVLLALIAFGVGPADGAPGDEIYVRPGQLAPAGDGARLNLYCLGSGSPAVVFDSGFLDWAPAWAVVQPQVARFTRACSYDRAGSGFSDPGPRPRTTARIATELHTALGNAGVAGPYILVGSAFGGDNVRAFADLFPGDVAGLVMVDADASDVNTPAARRKDDDNQGLVKRLRACRNGIASGQPPAADHCERLFFRGLPDTVWSSELNAELMRIAATKVAMWDADISELEQTPRDEDWLIKHRRSLGDRPIRVLTSGNHGVGHVEETERPTSLEHLEYEYLAARAQSRWLELSSNARQIFTPRSSEYIQFDQPQAVVDAIRDVFDQSKRRP